MPDSGSGPDGVMNGDPVSLSLRRAILELRDGRAIAVRDDAGVHVCASVETAEPNLVARFRSAYTSVHRVALPASSARWMGLEAPLEGVVEVEAPTQEFLERVAAAGRLPQSETGSAAVRRPRPAHRGAVAAVRLAKLARLRPAMIVAPAPAADADILSVEAEACLASLGPLQRIDLVASASVPLRPGLDTVFHVFRQPATGDEHVAVIVGRPADIPGPVAVRMHSACLTGDLFGSLRCDCGDQLRGAVEEIASERCGALLYLAQEGRGIGLANKMRAYALQDCGLDTVDADAALGFGEDERRYDVAAAMLTALGLLRVRVKTNNLRKIAALAEHGIVVEGREPLLAPVNAHNRPYLRAKALRAGHILGPEVTADRDDQAG